MRTLNFKILFLAVILFLTSVSYGATLKACDTVLVEISVTDNFIAYLSDLVKEGVLTQARLEHFMLQIDSNKNIVNPFADKNNVGSVYAVHSQMIDDYLNVYASGLDKDRIKQWVLSVLEDKTKNQIHKEKTEKATKDLIIRITFHEMPPANLRIPTEKGLISIDIEKPFAMMSTLVTQWMWMELRKIKYGSAKNPSDNNKGEATWNHPVESIETEGPFTFIEDLNELSNSSDVNIQTALRNVIPQHQQGDVYDFPTIQQIIAVRTNYGRNKQIIYDSDDLQAREWVGKHYWFEDNSGSQTHPVADLLPEIILDHDFYDLAGNVSIYTKNKRKDVLNCGIPMERPFVGYLHDINEDGVVAGGSFKESFKQMSAISFLTAEPGFFLSRRGLRLVRYRK